MPEQRDFSGYVLPAGIVLLGVAVWGKLFGESPGDKAWKAARILAAPQWWRSILHDGPSAAGPDLDWIKAHAYVIQESVEQFHEARGVLVDIDSRAIGAIQALPTAAAIAYSNFIFHLAFGATMSAYGAEFLSEAAKLAIADHIRRVGGSDPYNMKLS